MKESVYLAIIGHYQSNHGYALLSIEYIDLSIAR